MDNNNFNQNDHQDNGVDIGRVDRTEPQESYTQNSGDDGYVYQQNNQDSQDSYDQNNYNQNSYNQDSYNQANYNQDSYNQANYNQNGYAQNTYNPNDYMQNANQSYSNSNMETPMSLGDWIITFIVFAIPCVNIVMLFVWGFGHSGNTSRKNYCLAALIMGVIGVILYIGLFATLGVAGFRNVMNSTYSAM